MEYYNIIWYYYYGKSQYHSALELIICAPLTYEAQITDVAGFYFSLSHFVSILQCKYGGGRFASAMDNEHNRLILLFNEILSELISRRGWITANWILVIIHTPSGDRSVLSKCKIAHEIFRFHFCFFFRFIVVSGYDGGTISIGR